MTFAIAVDAAWRHSVPYKSPTTGDLESGYHARSNCKSGPADAQFPGDPFRLRRWRHIKPGRHVNDVQNPAACGSTITIDATGLSVTMPPIDPGSIATSASVRTKLTFYRYWQGASGSGERATWAPDFVSALPQIPVKFRHAPRQGARGSRSRCIPASCCVRPIRSACTCKCRGSNPVHARAAHSGIRLALGVGEKPNLP